MPKKSRKHSRSRRNKTSKKGVSVVMVGCSKNKGVAKSCPNCGPNCHCGPNCNCVDKCPGKCYLNHRLKGGTSGCGSCGCPYAPLSYRQMNQYGGFKYPPNEIPYPNGQPVIIDGTGKGEYKPILGTGQNGGTIPPIPGPKVGFPWGGSVSKWPGIDGISGNRNSLAQVKVEDNPQQQQLLDDSGYNNWRSLIGGSRRRLRKTSNKRKLKGGGIIPQDLVNLGRDFTFNLNSAYNALNGYKGPVNPLPYEQQQLTSFNNNNKIRF